MNKRSVWITLCPLLLLASACSSPPATTSLPPAGAQAAPPAHARTGSAQYLYIYNTGSPGEYHGQYARYSVPGLKLMQTTEADGVGSPEAFGSDGSPYFVDEGIPSGFALYLQPFGKNAVPAKQQFYGIPCQSTSLAFGPTGNSYAVQYCSQSVLEFAPGKKTGKPKKPIATYTGGNLTGTVYPTYAAVDPNGNLYVGDTGGGVTYFAAGGTQGVVALATSTGSVNQMIVDSHGDVWSIHGPNPTKVYFQSETLCILDPSGSVVRNEVAERFSNGTLAQRYYTAPTDSSVYAADGLSIAVDSSGRAYTGNQDTSDDGVLIDYNPSSSCPNENLSFVLPTRAFPQVAVDNEGGYYLTDYNDNTISSYKAASTKRRKQITQETGVISITYAAMSP
ncbi:MAG: hypothetical protein WB615_02625 [Candidatus Tumulicola sp.]